MATKKRPTKAEVEAAKTLLLAERIAEEQDRCEALCAHIGKFFRYRNSYGTGKKWWLYAAVTGVKPYIGCVGWDFQVTSNGEIEIRTNQMISIQGGGWCRISPVEFRSAARAVANRASKVLTGQ